MHINRRDLLALIAATSLMSACSDGSAQATRASATTKNAIVPPPTSTLPPTQTFTSEPIPAHPISTIPKGPPGGRQIALTIDDGIRADVIEGYARLCEKTGMRLTFFANGCYESWRETRNLLAPLVESGQITIGNHTFDHPDIRRSNITAHQLERQILDNEKVFRNLFGSQFSMRPYFRPPYGYYDAASLRQLRDMGYTCFTLWNGTTGDDQNISSSAIMRNLTTWSQPGSIVIGHANHKGILSKFDAVHDLFEKRALSTVTIADIYTH